MNILLIQSSIRGATSQSNQLAQRIVQRLLEENPAAAVAARDLAQRPHPMLDAMALEALNTPVEARSPEQVRRVALDDELIAEIQAADRVVLGVPMYNFGIPAQLKAWIDAIARARVTFRYTESGVEGLLKNKKVYVALTRGGRHRDTPADVQPAYLRTVLGFLGMTDIEFIYAEGLGLGPDAEREAFRHFEAELEAAFA